jgi:hypothetical protein
VNLEEMVSHTEVDIHPGTTEKPASTEGFFDLLSSDVDLGGFEPPLEHVSLSDVHKKANNKSPMQQGSNPTKSLTSLNDMNDVNRTVVHTSSDTVDFVPTEPFIVEIDSDDSTTTAADGPLKPQASKAIPADGEAARATDLVHDISTNAFPDESDEERKKRAYEEDQKRMWEGIDPWIYNEFHDYVELI